MKRHPTLSIPCSANRLRHWAAALLSALLGMALTACSGLSWLSGDEDPNPPTPLVKLAPEVDIQVLWSRTATRGTDGRSLHLVPALGDGQLFVADADGRVAAIDAREGHERWRVDLDLPLSGGPAVAGDRLVIGSAKGDLVALSTTDGSRLWQARTDSEILSVPQPAGDLIIVHTLDDTVYAFAVANGAEQWRHQSKAPVLILRGSSSPAVVPSGVIIGLAGGRLVKLDLAEGLPLWTTRVTPPTGRSELERITDLDADPIVIGDTAYVGTYNGDLAAIDVLSGAVLWRRSLSVHAGLAADGEALYITDSQDHLWAAKRSDGAGLWRQQHLANRRLSAPALSDGLVLVGDLDGYLHGIAQRDGRLVTRARLAKDRIRVRPLVAAGRIYVLADDGTLAAMTLGSWTDTGRATEATRAIVAPPSD